MHYTVCIGRTVEELDKMVNMMLRDGYKPQGGISVTQVEYEDGVKITYMYQAVYREKMQPPTRW